MTGHHTPQDYVTAVLADVTDRSPADELLAYEQVLEQLTDMLNRPDDPTPREEAS